MQSQQSLRALAAFDRDLIENVMQKVADYRAAGDIESIGAFLSSDVTLDLANGHPPKIPLPGQHHGREAVLFVLNEMRTDIEYLSYETLSLIVDHDQGFMRRRAQLRHRGTGRQGAVEIWDHYRFRNGLICWLALLPDMPGLLRLQG